MEWTNIISFIVRLLTFAPKRLSRNYRISRKIKGKWRYKCVLKSPYKFLDGGNCHGGVCDIQIKRTLLATQITISGERMWFEDYDNGKSTNHQILNPHRLWESEEGAFLSDKKFMYKYKIDTKAIEGFSVLEIVNNGKNLNGLFYYFPEEAELNESPNYFNSIFSSKPEKVSRFFKAYGHIFFERVT